MVTTDNEDLAWEARSFRDHGYDVAQRLSLLEAEQKLPYIHNMVGWNYRMTEMQSAIGLAELARMHKRDEDWDAYAEARMREADAAEEPDTPSEEPSEAQPASAETPAPASGEPERDHGAG
mgnify:CR=1 FL=1